MTLTIHLSTYGHEEQSVSSSRDILRILEVKGFTIMHATHNDIPIEPGEPS